MDRVTTYYVWLSKTGFSHWVLLTAIVASNNEVNDILQLMKNLHGDVGQVFATINCPQEYLMLIDDRNDVYKFIQEKE